MKKVLLSFCIPVMNRLADLKSTLRRNLEDNRVDQGRVEFVVVCFDKDAQTQDWIHDTFFDDLASGYLRFYSSNIINKWHFGRAKNAFRGIARGKIYSSLDADNFTGSSGAQQIIEVFELNAYNCIFHQFQGDWGDGTCGRVSMAMQDYEEIGYDDSFLPRQWDELDAILSIIVKRPYRQFVCYKGKSIVEKSSPFARFLLENNINIETIEIQDVNDSDIFTSTIAAVGQKKNSYVQDDERLKYSSIFNHLSSYFKNTYSENLRNQYVNELVDIQRTMAERLDNSLLLDWFLEPQQRGASPANKGGIFLVACLRNEINLESWLDYYRVLGVDHFLLVDDQSFQPISERIDAEDVWVWKPICGKFRYSKSFWLELLLRNFAQGCWVLTVDGDEYLDIPILEKGFHQKKIDDSILKQVVKWAGGNSIKYFAAFLLDLVPGKQSMQATMSSQPIDFADFNYYQFRPDNASRPYLEHNTVKWSYGEYGGWAQRIDIRFRLNRALDSLRKFPLFLMGPDVHLNQGFHDLIISGEKRDASEMARSELLLIRHYKLESMQYDNLDDETKPVDAYHQETKVNIDRLRGQLKKVLKFATMCPFTYPYYGPELVPVPCKEELKILLCENESAKATYSEVINRQAPVLLNIIDTDPRYRNGVLEARSMRDGVLWLSNVTPFNVIVFCDDSQATLRVPGAKKNKIPLSSSSYLSDSILTRGLV